MHHRDGYAEDLTKADASKRINDLKQALDLKVRGGLVKPIDFWRA
ncbi:hypothetical protein [Rhizobium rhizogenes]